MANEKMTNEKAIDALRTIIIYSENDGYTDKAREALKKGIEALRGRKTGKWKIYVISMLDGEGCKCSECGFEGAPYWHFCPNCGAEMEGIDDETN